MTSVVQSIASTATNMATEMATSMPTSATSTVAAPTATATLTPPGGDGGGTSKSLLFFVALGFGVVFTNLWIIVGVKYCFRYNRRARAAGLRDENGDPIDLANMPRPRRRREKKLMTMDEVNERFPLTKYKIWRATREKEGLPTEGGVTAPPSRAASIKDGIALARVSTEDASRPDTTAGASTSHDKVTPPTSSGAGQQTSTSDTQDFATSTLPATGDPKQDVNARKSHEINRVSMQEARPAMGIDADVEKAGDTTTQSGKAPEEPMSPGLEDDDEDDPIRTAVPAELLAAPGDSCAICIDTLEDDDEVRGLTCGHAFHAGCLDPWLTSRRACCPLCKADYYVPKPRPEGEQAEEDRQRRRSRRANPTTPAAVWIPSGRHGTFRPQILLTSARFTLNDFGRQNRRQQAQDGSNDQADDQQEQQDQPQTDGQTRQRSRLTSWMRRGTPVASRLRLPRWGAARQVSDNATTADDTAAATTTTTVTTPSQLEAGTRS